MRSHLMSHPVPDGELVAWKCARCSEWVNEYAPRSPCTKKPRWWRVLR